MLTYLGSIENSIIDFHSGKLTDISAKANKKSLSRAQKYLEILHKYNKEKLSPQEKISYDISDTCLKENIELNNFNYGTILDISTPYPVNQLFGMQSSLIEFMLRQHQIINTKSAKNYIARLAQFEIKFKNLIEELALREQNKIIPPRFVIDKVLDEINQFIKPSPQENILFTSFKNKIDNLKNITDKNKQLLAQQTIEVINKKVYPSYKNLIAFLEKQKQIATDDDGVWKLPSGDKFYAFCLKQQTSTNYTPKEIHDMGLQEVERIQKEMRQILDTVGYKDKTIKAAIKSMTNDPQFLYSDDDIGHQQALTDTYALFDNIKQKLPSLFVHIPQKQLKIEPVPAFKAKTSPAAYYEPGSLDGSRPGVFCLNTSDMKNVPKFSLATLAFHEGIPGHHFQISIAQELKNIPTLRRIVNFNAYCEGWALYCERLTWECGLIKDPFSNLGRLQMELFRAIRLVVDTGIHYKHWTRTQAIDYMLANTGMNETDVIAEIERYIVMPAQACSYKVGMMKILNLRQKMQEQLKDKFDIRLFHDIILRNGSMPLNLLEKYVDEEIANGIHNQPRP
jgi:uncharacterized protein (DUF885 family)